MAKIGEPSKKFIIRIPMSYIKWIDDHKISTKEFDYRSDYFRYLIRQDIQRVGPLPQPIEKSRKKGRSASQPGGTPPATSDSAPPPSA